jgi:hypothetical protein
VPPLRPLWLVLAGTIGIFAGEILCIVGPLRYERLVDVTCHAAIYAGIVLVLLGAALHWVSRVKRPPET